MSTTEKTVALDNFTFNFNFKHLLFVVLLLAGLYFLSQYLTIKQAISNAPTYNYEEVAAIAEEIYTSGEVSDGVNNLPLEASVLAKLISELERILQKTTDYPGCELYYLRARFNGKYPILMYGNQITGYANLKVSEVWKIGQTCNGEELRYPRDIYYTNKVEDISMTNEELLFEVIQQGSYKEILILEKLMIYTYPFWSGHPELAKPPGCKIYR